LHLTGAASGDLLNTHGLPAISAPAGFARFIDALPTAR
jgi:hypothetical protein